MFDPVLADSWGAGWGRQIFAGMRGNVPLEPSSDEIDGRKHQKFRGACRSMANNKSRVTRAIILLAVIWALCGCTAIYSLSSPVERESFDAKGATVEIRYLVDQYRPEGWEPAHCFGYMCRGGDSASRIHEVSGLLAAYGFRPFGGAGVPDFTLVISERRDAFAKFEDEPRCSPIFISWITLGVVPCFSTAYPSRQSYSLYRGKDRLLSRADGQTEVRLMGSFISPFLEPLKNKVNKSALLNEHEKIIQEWIQGGLFDE